MSTLAEPRAVLSNLIRTVIVPRLCAAVELSQRPAVAVDPGRAAAAELVELLRSADPEQAFRVACTAFRAGGSLGALAATLLEPAARCLGDLWQADDCSDVDMSLGLVRLQIVLHRLAAGMPRRTSLSGVPSVMVVTPPGEPHQLGAAFDAELLWHAGWNPRLDFPETDAALVSLLGQHWVDALDISLSPSLRREHRLSRLAETIRRARRASLNPELVVVVSGRIFHDPRPAGELDASRLGADASFASALTAETTIRRAWLRTASRPQPMSNVR